MSREILATYRLQLHSNFGFREAAALGDYLAALGISHVYCSPCLQATPGSAHGYDVIDHSQVSADLGGEEEFARMCAGLRDRLLGLVVDLVPNHMAISGWGNQWWWDVLENGPSSKFAAYFDVEWDSPEQRLRNLVLLPVLGDHYGRVLEAGELQLVRNGAKFVIRYKDRIFPVAPRSIGVLLTSAALRCNSEMLSFLAEGLAGLPLPTATDDIARRHRDKQLLEFMLADLISEHEVVARTIDRVVAEINADPNLLDQLLERQNYRLAFWRTAERDLGYRRFFDINTLVGLRTETQAVFDEIHALPLRWASAGLIDGMRIDHVDGLRDPTAYLQRLRDAAPQAWIVVEKILMPGERLRTDWPVAGTTGYDFLNLCNGLFIDPAAEEPFTRFYTEFTGESADFEALCREKKRAVLSESLGSDLNRLTHLLLQVCERHRRHRDYTRHQIHEALREVVACFPVYRTYARADSVFLEAPCVSHIITAVEQARRGRPDVGNDLFDFLGDVLLRRIRGDAETELVLRLQQLTPPAIAKGVEDTAFYCFNRAVSLNEVGGDPRAFGTPPGRFYAAAQEMSRTWPRTMLASSTHDTKRSEDVRARLNVLSEIPHQWCAEVARWSRRNDRHWPSPLRDRNIEYLLYQTLVGTWPISEQRLLAYLEKAAREAKQHTSWTHPDPVYEAAIRDFAAALLHDSRFLADLEEFVQPLIPLGRLNSLSQTLLKLTAPGVPDLYQGTELWNFALVDPDNRTPVDYESRRRLLSEVEHLTVSEIMRRADEGLPKLWVVRQALRLRRHMPEAFGPSAGFESLGVVGSRREHAIAYSRGGRAVTVAPRLVAKLQDDWRDTSVELPAGEWRNEFTGAQVGHGAMPLRSLLGEFPVCLLSRT
ncbi:MAG: malto-oligosyltrehalose synthase [Deltaproteobacteria bacterium]|nr:malto-oligosyltrehalose synthase [Deltaproteobacteria bacterium]